MLLKNRQAGFSLIEIMIVVVILGIVLSVASLSLGVLGGERELQTEARRFMALAEVAQDEATMQGRDFGIEIMTTAYRFVEYDALGAQWADIPDDETLRLRSLPNEIEFELLMEDTRVLLDDDPAQFDDPDERSLLSRTDIYAPHLLVYSSGDTTPFELRLLRRYDDRAVVIRGNALGAMEIINEDED